jgi:hypothetical protein
MEESEIILALAEGNECVAAHPVLASTMAQILAETSRYVAPQDLSDVPLTRAVDVS